MPKMKNLGSISALCAGTLMMLVLGVSQATTLSFINVENNSTIDLSPQLSVDVTSVGNTAYFQFENDVDSGSYASITDIYFGYDTTLTTVSFDSDSGANVSFTDGATPGNLSGGTFTAGYSTDADPGGPTATLKENGVDETGEFIKFAATLGSSFDFLALMDAIDNGSFNIGVHVQALAGDLSDSYEVSTVPVPAAAWLFGTAILGFFASSRCKKRS